MVRSELQSAPESNVAHVMHRLENVHDDMRLLVVKAALNPCVHISHVGRLEGHVVCSILSVCPNLLHEVGDNAY